jgi:hypothetical protein
MTLRNKKKSPPPTTSNSTNHETNIRNVMPINQLNGAQTNNYYEPSKASQVYNYDYRSNLYSTVKAPKTNGQLTGGNKRN